MTGPKLNEAPVRVSGHRRVRVAEETTAFRAKGRYLRVSAYKVREVLDLIRGLDAERARETLRLSDRDAADVVDKVLASAIANAEHHHEHPVDGEELYVSACYADEGPTLKRWRPRARGRATRIRKRTCHITVIVSRLPDEELRERRARQPGAGDRRRRTAASKRAAARKQAAPTAEEEAAPVEDAAPVEEQEEGAPVEDEAPVEQEEAAPVEEQEGAASEQEADAAPEAGQEEEEK
ncbi:MAG: 50S ribosomal protein L22 [Acidimicrobiia bacterium]|nr:50S ribosomal protein L22 [Acidimicrobiia bacterium]